MDQLWNHLRMKKLLAALIGLVAWICLLPLHDASAGSPKKISATSGEFAGTLDEHDMFGWSVEAIGDLDGDGITDIAVGAWFDDDGGTPPDANRSAVWILFLESDGTVKAHTKISDTSGGFTAILDDEDYFGVSLAHLGDVNGDGTDDLAVGAYYDDDDDDGSDPDNGAVYILMLNSDGTVDSHMKISETSGGFGGDLKSYDWFGWDMAAIGDLDGDGVTELAVSADGDDEVGSDHGAVWILFLEADGTVKEEVKINESSGGFTGTLKDGDWFGASLAALKDVDGDGLVDLAVGADSDDGSGVDQGAVYILFLHADGSVKDHAKINNLAGGFSGPLDDGDIFGIGTASVGDLDEDGVTDIAVGAYGDDDGGSDRGAVYLLWLGADGSVTKETKITSISDDFDVPLDLHDGDEFGISIALLGDLDGDGAHDLVVSAPMDDDGSIDAGAVWIISLEKHESPGPDDVPVMSRGGLAFVALAMLALGCVVVQWRRTCLAL